MKKIVVIAGVTASGKSKLAIELAKAFRGEIISADSVAVYHELDIGSAKLMPEEMEGIPHHLINVTSITDAYNVARFQSDARQLIDEIITRGNLPIIVGGTGLYINALVYDYRFEHENIEFEDDERETQVIYDELKQLDPESAEAIHPNNRQRIIRSLQMVKTNKKSRTEVHDNDKNTPLYNAKIFFLNGERELLYERMNQRVNIMFEKGLLEEVTRLHALNPEFFELQATQAIGYREFKAYFDQEQSIEETKELIQRNTRRFAKRQMTWFKHQTPNISIDIFNDDLSTISEIIQEFIKER